MVVIVCLDRTGGMMFNGRRQSRDKAVMERIQQICMGGTLWIAHGSYALCHGLEQVHLAEDGMFLQKAENGEFCFVESGGLAPVAGRIEEIIAFYWNRDYPADTYLDLDLSKWKKGSVQEFPGSSHERITEVHYTPDGQEGSALP